MRTRRGRAWRGAARGAAAGAPIDVAPRPPPRTPSTATWTRRCRCRPTWWERRSRWDCRSRSRPSATVARRATRPPGRLRVLPGWTRRGLRVVGVRPGPGSCCRPSPGGDSDAEVASLILWVFGWVGLAAGERAAGPGLDAGWTPSPRSSTWSRAGPGALAARRRIRRGRSGAAPRRRAGRPPACRAWPAVGLLGCFVWLELVAQRRGRASLGLVLVGLHVVTLAGMAWFGRDRWRERAEVFSVWFGLLGRLAPYGLEGRAEGAAATPRVRQHPGAAGPGGTRCWRSWPSGRDRSSGTASRRPSHGPTWWAARGCLATSLLLAAFLGASPGSSCVSPGRGPRGHGCRPRARHDGLRRGALPGLPARGGSAHRGGGTRIRCSRAGTSSAPPPGSPATTGWRRRCCGPSRSLPSSWGMSRAHGSGTERSGESVARGGQVSQWPLAALMVALTVLALWSLGQNLVFVARSDRGAVRPSRRRSAAAARAPHEHGPMTCRPSTPSCVCPSRSTPP